MPKRRYVGSMFNQKYFEGYKKRIVIDEDGNQKIEFVYEGTYYHLDADERTWKRKKLLILAQIILCIAAVVLAMAWNSAVNGIKWLVALQVLLFFSLLGLLLCGCFRLGAKYRMTQYEYRMSVVSVREFALLSVIFAALLLLAVPSVLIARDLFLPSETVQLLAYLAVSGMLIWMFFSVKGERYIEEESHDMPHGVDITNDFAQEEE
ncbi:MAG: hypothetical protein ACI3VB_02310 [Oscillospiraceae bacterium]